MEQRQRSSGGAAVSPPARAPAAPLALPRRSGLPAEAVAVSVALAVHSIAFASLARLHSGAWLVRRPQTVEMEVIERPPPPPPPVPEVKPPEPPPPPKPVVRRVVVKAPRPEAPPPPPNQEPPPTPPPEPTPPTFGVTMDSVVTGDSPVAVPVGSTLMTKDRTPGRPAPPAPVAVAEAPSFAPVAETSIGEFPHVIHEEKATSYYPSDARRMGFEGRVVLKVGIDRHGAVRSVRVVKKAGYGFDEAAIRAMWKFTFTPARTRDGQPVDFLITYGITFQTPER
jgi:protein TonB